MVILAGHSSPGNAARKDFCEIAGVRHNEVSECAVKREAGV